MKGLPKKGRRDYTKSIYHLEPIPSYVRGLVKKTRPQDYEQLLIEQDYEQDYVLIDHEKSAEMY